MALKMTIEKHGTAYPSKVKSSTAGHIYNILIDEDTDNGNFVAKGTWNSFDLYDAATPTTFAGVVRQKSANGNYYVEVTTPGDALFVYQVPMIEEEYNKEFMKEENFYNAADTVVRAYELAAGDILEISAAGFASAPSIGASVALSAIAGKTHTMQLA